MSRRFARAGAFAADPGDMEGAQIAFVQEKAAAGMSHQNIARMLGVSIADVAEYAGLELREIDRRPKYVAPAQQSPEERDGMVLSLWRGLIPREPGKSSMALILERVAADYHLSVADLKSPSRCAAIARPRQDFMWRCRQEKNTSGKPLYSLPRIAAFLGGFDHTTVLHGVRAHAKRLASLQQAREAA